MNKNIAKFRQFFSFNFVDFLNIFFGGFLVYRVFCCGHILDGCVCGSRVLLIIIELKLNLKLLITEHMFNL